MIVLYDWLYGCVIVWDLSVLVTFLWRWHWLVCCPSAVRRYVSIEACDIPAMPQACVRARLSACLTLMSNPGGPPPGAASDALLVSVACVAEATGAGAGVATSSTAWTRVCLRPAALHSLPEGVTA